MSENETKADTRTTDERARRALSEADTNAQFGHTLAAVRDLVTWAGTVEDRLAAVRALLPDAAVQGANNSAGNSPITPEVTDEPGVGAVVRDREGREWTHGTFPRSHPWTADDVPGDPSTAQWSYLRHRLAPLTLVRPAAAPEGEAGEECLSSDEWCARLGWEVMDPDGWDRKNFAASWAERITEDEFIRRLGRSTVCPVKPAAPTPPPSDDEAVERAKSEPILVSGMRGHGGTVRHDPATPGRGSGGTSADGFLREYDEAIEAAYQRGRESVIAAGWREVGAGQVVVERDDVMRLHDLTTGSVFYEKGHPGRPARRSGWLGEDVINRWSVGLSNLRAALNAGSTS